LFFQKQRQNKIMKRIGPFSSEAELAERLANEQESALRAEADGGLFAPLPAELLGTPAENERAAAIEEYVTHQMLFFKAESAKKQVVSVEKAASVDETNTESHTEALSIETNSPRPETLPKVAWK
jgi:hypothetical protein